MWQVPKYLKESNLLIYFWNLRYNVHFIFFVCLRAWFHSISFILVELLLPQDMHSCIGCTKATFFVWFFPLCVFSGVSSNGLPEQMHSHIAYICVLSRSPQHVFSNVSSKSLPDKMHSHIGCICVIYPPCEFSNVTSNCPHEQMHSHNGHTCVIYPQYGFSNVSSIGLPS